MPLLGPRLPLGLGLLALAIVGASLSAPLCMVADIDAQLARVKSHRRVPRRPANVDESLPPVADSDEDRRAEARFAMEFARDLDRWHLPAMKLKRLAAPFVRENLLRSPIVLKPGRARRLGPLELKVEGAKLPVPGTTGTVARRHTLLKLHNRSKKFLAYRVDAGVVRGRGCGARATIKRDILTMRPGERVRISLCKGRQKVRVRGLDVIFLPRISAIYLQQLPPGLLAADAAAQAAHRPRRGVLPCSAVPVQRLRGAFAAGDISWSDVVDFYARHNCQRWQMPLSYRRRSRGRVSLPAI